MNFTPNTPDPGQPAGQPVEQPAPQAQAPAPVSAPVLTPEQERIVEQKAAAIAEQKFNEFRAKENAARNRMEARINKALTAYEKRSGQPATEDVKASIREAIAQEDQPDPQQAPAQSAQPAPGQAQASQVPAQTPPQKTWIDVRVEQMEKAAGIEINQADPEAKALNDAIEAGKDPLDWLALYQTQIETKRARVSLGSPASRTVTIAGGSTPGNPIGDIVDPATLISMGLKTLGKK